MSAFIRSGCRAASAALLVAGAMAMARPSAVLQAPATPDTTAALGDSTLEARTSAVAAQLRCPVCQGLSLQDSPSELARSMRDLVREQLAEGRTPDQVKAYFVSKYGEWILLEPKPRGFNLVAYAVPILVVIGGGAVIAFAVRRWTAGAPPVPAEQTPVQDQLSVDS